MSNPFLLRHWQGESTGRFPVWMMRQAGRYLPTYRAIREHHTFWQMVTRPEIAAQVSLLPLEVVPVDAVIFFSDILTLPYGMGIPVEMRESVGPVLTEPLMTEAAFDQFGDFDPQRHTSFVGEALTLIRERMPGDTALLGFAGAPWTVACYLVEGKGNKQFSRIKSWMYRDPRGLARALGRFADATVDYLLYQVSSGAHAVQLFDTWLGEMPREFFREHYLPLLNRILARLREREVRVIYFPRHAHHLWPDFPALEVGMLSLDSLLPLGEADGRLAKKFLLQGNLDPALLLGDTAVVRRETRRLVQEARALGKPTILNLGHGIYPGTPVENVQAFVEEARTLWI